MDVALRSITRNQEQIEEWKDALEGYDYTDDDPEIGVYTRYIDLREVPPQLKNGGIVVDYDESTIKIKIGWPRPRFWTIQRGFHMIFQKRSFRVSIIKLAQDIVDKKIGFTE